MLANLVGSRAVDEACAKDLVALTQEALKTRVRLAHPLYGEVHRSRTGELRLRQLRGRIVHACEHTPAVDARDLIHRALLLLESDLAADVTLFTQSAGAAMQLLDPALAARLAGASPMMFGYTLFHAQALSIAGYQVQAEALTNRWARQTAEIPVASSAYTALSAPTW